MSLAHYFVDPILRAPTWGCMLMCLSASLIGVIVFLRKKSLLAESLSHASYPGVVFAIFALAAFFPAGSEWSFLAVLIGAFSSCFCALSAIEWLEKKGKVFSDAALSFVLSIFFGLGVVGSSALQGFFPSWSKQVQMLLFGQVATMTDVHIAIYASLAVGIILFLAILYRPLQAILLDTAYAKSLGIRVALINRFFQILLLLSTIVGMRSVGVILLSGMLIAPAVAARQYTNRLATMFWLSACFGVSSALLGYVLSVEASIYAGTLGDRFSLPTGPLIVLVSTFFAFFSLCFAPQRGIVFRLARIFLFKIRCLQENILKALWKKKVFTKEQLRASLPVSFLLFHWILWRMKVQGWLEKKSDLYELTGDGYKRAAAIVRLHRLWEVYLTHYLGQDPHCVHRNAEEMEHILTPDLERRLTTLLANPKTDPHQQPIPERPRL